MLLLTISCRISQAFQTLRQLTERTTHRLNQRSSIIRRIAVMLSPPPLEPSLGATGAAMGTRGTHAKSRGDCWAVFDLLDHMQLVGRSALPGEDELRTRVSRLFTLTPLAAELRRWSRWAGTRRWDTWHAQWASRNPTAWCARGYPLDTRVPNLMWTSSGCSFAPARLWTREWAAATAGNHRGRTEATAVCAGVRRRALGTAGAPFPQRFD